MRTVAFRVPSATPREATDALRSLFDERRLHPREIVAVLGKTGEPDANATERAIVELGAARLELSSGEVSEKWVLGVSPTYDGISCPHLLVLGRRDDEATLVPGHLRLASAVGRTRRFDPAEVGTMAQVVETARVVEELTAGLEVDSPNDVHLVHVSAALPAGIAPERARTSASFSRGASALGVAVAMREASLRDLDDQAICSRWEAFSTNASVLARPSAWHSEVVVLANSPKWSGDLVAAHGTLSDVLDAEGIWRVFETLGMSAGSPSLSPRDRRRIVGSFARCEPDPRGSVRGMSLPKPESEEDARRRIATSLGAVVGSVAGEPSACVSVDAEHVGPLGGGAVTVIARY